MAGLTTSTVLKEADFLFDKTYECPACYQKFKARTVKNSKMRLVRTDTNLRPVYEQGEPLKYEAIVCPECGYSALNKFFGSLTPTQSKAIKENISSAFKAKIECKETYSYEEAIIRYKLSYASTVAKHGKTSEKAYTCLKLGWLYRSMQENMDVTAKDYDKKKEIAGQKEKEFLKNALDGFLEARQTEDYPMCGMDEITVEYLLAVLSMEFEEYDVSSKLISGILASHGANSRMKDKAREIKEMLMVRMKEKNG